MGSVEVHVRMSPMAAPTYEDGKLGSKGIELMRVLEILLRDCGVIDLESLCIRKYKQVEEFKKFSFLAKYGFIFIFTMDLDMVDSRRCTYFR